MSSAKPVSIPKKFGRNIPVRKAVIKTLNSYACLGLQLTEWAHQRHRQVEAEVMNRRECQAVSRTDGSMGDKPRSGLKRWGRHKPRFGLRRQPESSLVGFITLKGDLIRSQLLNICAC